MFINSFLQIVCNPNVKNSFILVGYNVNEVIMVSHFILTRVSNLTDFFPSARDTSFEMTIQVRCHFDDEGGEISNYKSSLIA